MLKCGHVGTRVPQPAPGVAAGVHGRCLQQKESRNPLNPTPRGSWTGQVSGRSRPLLFLRSATARRGFNGKYQWYWGAQGGAFVSKHERAGRTSMIDRRRALADHRAPQRTVRRVRAGAVPGQSAGGDLRPQPRPHPRSARAYPRRSVQGRGRRIAFGVLAIPAQKVIEPFGGGRFALMQVLNPEISCPAGGARPPSSPRRHTRP